MKTAPSFRPAFFAASFLVASGLLYAEENSTPAPAMKLPIADGPFKPADESFKQYKYPDWFRDAKFGMWAHWGPQAVPRHGDWYARKMYQENTDDYKDHLARYG